MRSDSICVPRPLSLSLAWWLYIAVSIPALPRECALYLYREEKEWQRCRARPVRSSDVEVGVDYDDGVVMLGLVLVSC